MTTKFDLGRLVITNGISDKMADDVNFVAFIHTSLNRYVACDWGDVCDEDKQTNDSAIIDGERILAVYIYPKDGTKVWIITEWNRSATTILFPSEY